MVSQQGGPEALWWVGSIFVAAGSERRVAKPIGVTGELRNQSEVKNEVLPEYSSAGSRPG